MTGPYIVSPTRPGDTPRNSIQLNVIVVVDVARALANGNLDGALMLVDNSVDQAGRPSAGRGTPALVTQCNAGMVINWIVYPVGPFGVPAPVAIESICFDEEVCFKLASYGAVDIARSPDYVPGVTPGYDYWAGLVLPGLAPKRYRYRIELTLGDARMGASTPSLNVWDVPVAPQVAPHAMALRGQAQPRIVG
jgi:hypothetical protein